MTEERSGIVPIGRPLPGQHVAVADERGRPIQRGEVGELWLGGPQVTPGYWMRPDLTRASFVSQEASGRSTRWYRTGDLAHLDELGMLHFHGRRDRQTKVSGFRIELDEVDAVLRSVAGCESVATLPWSQLSAEGVYDQLVAFVCGTAHNTEEILAGCRRSLPSYSVPARIFAIDEWPLTANGKTDFAELRRMIERFRHA